MDITLILLTRHYPAQRCDTKCLFGRFIGNSQGNENDSITHKDNRTGENIQEVKGAVTDCCDCKNRDNYTPWGERPM